MLVNLILILDIFFLEVVELIAWIGFVCERVFIVKKIYENLSFYFHAREIVVALMLDSPGYNYVGSGGYSC